MQATRKNWTTFQPITEEASNSLAGYKPFMQQLLFNRGIKDAAAAESYLNGSVLGEDPFHLLDMDKAVDRLLKAADRGETVAVYGDYDVDGVSATALMVEVLRSFGINAYPYIPNRFEEGYGLNLDAIEMLADSGVTLILTVDCGIRSLAEADFARSKQVDLIISDHHFPKEELPSALAVIDPKRENDAYIYKDLAGVGLAYKIAEALFTRRNTNSRNAEEWLDLVALGTVSDIVPLTGENRTLVKRGLGMIRTGRRLGISSLLRAARKDPFRITASDIGFILGPRLNAAGRMDSAKQALNLLLTNDALEAVSLAQKLDNQNMERQNLTKDLQSWIAEKSTDLEGRYLISDVSLAEFDYSSYKTTSGAGIMGLVAAKLVESYYRPAVIGTEEGDLIKASCRSIPEFHITKALDECADLLVRHGGHSMAAGFTVRKENAGALLEKLQQIAEQQLIGQDLKLTLRADMEFSINDLPGDALDQLKRLEPTGQSNPEARFISRNVEIKDVRKIGKDQSHLKFKIPYRNGTLEAVAWKQGHWADEMPGKVDLFYSVEENTYGNLVTTQLNVRDLQPASDSALSSGS